VSPEVSVDVVSTVRRLRERASYPVKTSLIVLELPRSTYFDWARQDGGGKRHRPPSTTPKGHHITPEEREAVISFAREHPELGHKRLAYAMVDAGVAAVRPTTVYNILKQAGLIGRWKQPAVKAHKKGFDQPSSPHEQWHTDIAYLNILGTQYFLISVLDGFSRAIIHHDVRLQMETSDVELVIQRALDCLPPDSPRPRIISDNGSQYVSNQFKVFLRQVGCSHSKTRVRHPQSNGKMERWHKTAKNECVRRMAFADLDEARAVIAAWVKEYNETRLHSALNYLAPCDYLKGAAHIAKRLAERQASFTQADIQRRAYWAKERVA
jgi:transposase InsO family protein